MDTVIRVAVVYLFLLAALRVMGKRQFSQLAPIDLVVLILIPEILSQSLIRDDYSLTNAIVAISTLMALVFLTSLLRYFLPAVETLTEGKPTILVRDGRAIPEALARERVPASELTSEMHKYGLADLEEVRWAILESDGTITFIPKDVKRMQLRVPEESVQ